MIRSLHPEQDKRGGVILFDTPSTICKKFKKELHASKLRYICKIKEEAGLYQSESPIRMHEVAAVGCIFNCARRTTDCPHQFLILSNDFCSQFRFFLIKAKIYCFSCIIDECVSDWMDLFCVFQAIHFLVLSPLTI